jgi:hypothetical protein
MNNRKIFLAAVIAFATAVPSAFALPGAHGPNGEHLDAPSGNGSSAPRIEAKSEAFELVGQLQGAELSILINRFETNEPVLGAAVEIESGNLKAKAPFHADHGDYAVADEAFLKAIAKPGAHALVVTVTAGSDADLLEGTLNVPEAADDHEHHGLSWRGWALGALGLVFFVAAVWRVARIRRAPSVTTSGRTA